MLRRFARQLALAVASITAIVLLAIWLRDARPQIAIAGGCIVIGVLYLFAGVVSVVGRPVSYFDPSRAGTQAASLVPIGAVLAAVGFYLEWTR